MKQLRIQKIKRKQIAVLLLWAFVASLIPPIPSFATSEENHTNTIYITNAADLIALGKNCTVDTWSQNKIVELTSDIDLSAMAFTPIPSFSGTFRGNGHTISGINLTAKGSYQGLFRHIEKSGKVENLTVRGNIAPEGKPKYLGGIAGENNGTITYCAFYGTITGKSNIGGITGYSGETGSISYSSAHGDILGESYTGGITGQNFGVITNCQNNANINTVTIDKKKSLSDLEPDGNIDLADIRSTENLSVTTDTGGIAGYSKGKIDSCKNYGNIGYQHVGYNTGGICGRQAGIITGCENTGAIYGRKDVGGICGQAEPYIIQAYSKDALQQLNDTLRNTQSTLNNMANRSDHEITDTLNNINQQLGEIADTADNMTDSALDYADTVITDTNDLLRRVSISLDYMETALARISTATVKFGSGIVALEEAGDSLLKYLHDVAAAVKKENQDNTQLESEIKQAENTQQNNKDIAASSLSIELDLQDHVDDLQAGIDNGTVSATDIQPIKEDIGALAQQIAVSESYLANIEDILRLLQQQGYLPDDETINALLTQLGITAEEITAIKQTIEQLKNQLPEIGKDLDPAAIQEAIKKLQDIFQQLEQQLQSLKTTIAKTTAAIQAMKKQAPELGNALDSLEDGLYDIERGMDYLTLGTTELKRALKTINAGNTLQIPEIDNEFRSNIDDLQASLDGIQENVSHLNTTVANTQDDLIKDFTAINGQFLQILNILSDAYDRNNPNDNEDMIEDLSDSNPGNISQGKITTSQNSGTVQADINTGGIVGSMAIEYDFDPEDDVTKQGASSLRFTYQTKAVIDKCQNYGIIIGKKNYVGAIVGKMELGTVQLCEGYGNAESTDGSFVGGIAGASEGFIRNSIAKCTLAGDDFIGGITGQGKTISGCYTLVHIARAEENQGAIAGIDSEEKQDIKQNYFVSPTLGGIDGISYQGRAEAITIDDFCNFVEKNFRHEVSFLLTYCLDDEIIATLPYVYGKPIDKALIPAVPEKDGYFGAWSEYDYDMPLFDATLEAEYERGLEILPSSLKRDGKAVLLVCGAFDNQAQLSIAENTSENKILGKGIIHSYHIKITDNNEKDRYQIRYLPERKNSEIIIANGDVTQKVNTKPFGRYIECMAQGQAFTLYEVSKNNYYWFYGLIALLLLGSGQHIYRKKYPKKQKNKKEKEPIHE